MRGLIAGVVGGMAGAVNQIADGQIATNQRADLHAQMAQVELEKQLRIDEVKRNRDILDIGRKAEATAQAAPILAQGEAQGVISMANTPGYLDSVRQMQAAGESSATRASAGLTSDRRNIEAEINALRRQLSQTTDDTERANIQRQINDLSGSPATGARTYGDMVAAAGHYSRMAQNLRRQAEEAYDPSEREQLLSQAQRFENQADSILQETRGRRLGDAGITLSSSPSDGERRSVSRSGQPIVFRDGQWVYEE